MQWQFNISFSVGDPEIIRLENNGFRLKIKKISFFDFSGMTAFFTVYKC
jgi:hypothetical protein